MAMPDDVLRLIREEQVRQGGRFVPDLTAYLDKIDQAAELVVRYSGPDLAGFVFFYCNDDRTRQAFVTLIAVAPEARGTGLASALIGHVVDVARDRGFAACGLEVDKANAPARALYARLGFEVAEDRGGKLLLELRWAEHQPVRAVAAAKA